MTIIVPSSSLTQIQRESCKSRPAPTQKPIRKPISDSTRFTLTPLGYAALEAADKPASEKGGRK